MLRQGFAIEEIAAHFDVSPRTIHRKLVAIKDVAGGNLPVGERAIFKLVNGYKSRDLKISKSNGSKVKRLQNEFSSAMEKEHRRDYFNHNIGYIVFGVFLSILVIALTLIFGGVDDDTIGFTIFIGFFSVFAGFFVFHLGRMFARGRSMVGKIISIVMLSVFAFMFFSGALLAFCGQTGCSVGEVAFVGDNIHDLETGRRGNAGLVVGVLTGTSTREHLARHADVVLNSIVELPELLGTS